MPQGSSSPGWLIHSLAIGWLSQPDVEDMLLMPLLAGLMIDDRRKLRRLVLEQHEFSALEALAVTRLDASCARERGKLGQIGGRLVAA